MPRKKKYNPDEVLDKALNVFWETGYESTSVRILEEQMGINQFSIYASFGSKKELFLSVLNRYREYVLLNIFSDLFQNGESIGQIKAFFENYIEWSEHGFLKKGCLMVNTIVESANKDEEIEKYLESYFDQLRSGFSAILDRAKDNGELTGDANTESLAILLVGNLQALSIMCLTGTRETQRIYVDQLFESINHWKVAS